jgi:hypothetical protein
VPPPRSSTTLEVQRPPERLQHFAQRQSTMSHLVDVNALEMARLAWTYARATDTHPVSFDAPDAASKIWLALCRHYQQRLYGNAGRHSFLRSSRELLFATIDQARRGDKCERDVAVIFVELSSLCLCTTRLTGQRTLMRQ